MILPVVLLPRLASGILVQRQSVRSTESAELGLAVSSPPLAVGAGDVGRSVLAGIAFNHRR